MNNWKILSIELNNKEDKKENVIKRIHWMRYSDVNNINGTLSFDSIDINNFIDYDNLNIDILISWLESKIDKNYLDTLLNDMVIEKEKSKTIHNPFE